MKKSSYSIIFLAVLSLSVPAWAGSILDLPIGDNGQVRLSATGHTRAVGSGIPISEMIYGSKTLDMVSGRMYFFTGQGTGFKGNTIFYGPGGKFVIRGCVDGDGDSVGKCGGKKDVRGALMTGTFLDAKIVKKGNEFILIAQFLEQLNPALAKLLDLPTESEGEFELLLTRTTSPPRWTLTNVEGGSLNILSEPASIVTMGTSLMGLFLILGASTVFRRRT